MSTMLIAIGAALAVLTGIGAGVGISKATATAVDCLLYTSGIIAALETLEEKDAFEIYEPDIVLYDVLGDVVCGGFAMPIREGYAEKVFLLTSGENMAIHAAAKDVYKRQEEVYVESSFLE